MAVMDYKLYTAFHRTDSEVVSLLLFTWMQKKREMNRRYKSVRSQSVLVSAKVVTSCRCTLYDVMFK